ncbi:MAG: UDP-4-amino-4,6-dideoxy-N-acetyl-beta-L-altrosamine transaminase [Elusimicrobiota bacterium]
MIPYGRQTIEEDDIRAVTEVLRSDWLTQGPRVTEFEQALAEYCGAKHAVAMVNGTAALQAAYFAAGFEEGDEFVTTPLTFAATASMGLWFGARPVFADIDPDTGNLDPKQVERLITEKTKAIVPVDYSGLPVDLDAFRQLAQRHRLFLIEDGCHALGASYQGRKIGSISDMTVFSFHPVKSITTGEGGAVLTNDDELAAKLSRFRMHGITHRSPDWRYDICCLALNYRITDIQCALGISQLRKLDGFIRRREEIAAAYLEDLVGVEELRLPPAAAAGACAWHLFPVRLKSDREAVFHDLRGRGIGVQVHYIPVYQHSLYRKLGYASGACPLAERFYEEELSLPIFPTLAERERRRVVQELLEALASGAGKAR